MTSKQIIILLLLSLNASIVSAGHLLGGEFTYKCTDFNRYELNFTVYRSCLCEGGTEDCAYFDQMAVVSKFKGNQFNSKFLFEDDMFYTGKVLCSNEEPPICIQQSSGYTGITYLSIGSEFTTITYMRCCRTPNTLNIKNVENSGSTLLITIPPIDLVECNNSPVFNTPPPPYVKANENFEYDHSATDEDGDSLVYQLCTPFDYPLDPRPVDEGGDGPSLTNTQIKPPPPPYNFIEWEDSMSEEEPLGPQSTVSIDPNTGLLKIYATSLGQFVIAICVSEYKDGQFLGSIMRDFQYNIVEEAPENDTCDCSPDLASVWCYDFNDNGLGDPNNSVVRCEQPRGFVSDCTDVNDLVSIDKFNENSFTVYPNPSNGYFRIKTNETIPPGAVFTLYSASGKLITPSKLLKQDEIQYTQDNLANGLYYLQIRNENKILQKKLVLLK